MGDNKRFWWIKLPTNFFNSLEQKKMRKQENGLMLQAIYLRLLLLSCNNNGAIAFQGVFDTIAEEIAEQIGESMQDVEKALRYYEDNKMVIYQGDSLLIPQAENIAGSETQSTIRSRECRERQRALQCNTSATHMQQNATERREREEKEKSIEESEEKLQRNEETTNPRSNYGCNKNIPLTQNEYNELCNTYSTRYTIYMIDRMSAYIVNKNKSGDYASFDRLCEWLNEERLKNEKEMDDALKEEQKNKKGKQRLKDLEKYYLEKREE